MVWLKRKSDPITARSKALNAEIAALEAEIKRLDTRLQREQQQEPGAVDGVPATIAAVAEAVAPIPTRTGRSAEIIIEGRSRALLSARPGEASTPQHYNELGVRKYDLLALLRRVRSWFAGPAPSNPQLLKMLAAGNIEGLRPLRIEKRKARRRFLVLVTVLFLVLLGLISAIVRHR